MRLALLPLALCAWLAACETMTEDQCRRADWTDRGRRDGAAGETESYIEAHRKACAKAGVTPDLARWRQGWFDGVRGYCTPRSAWSVGLRDGSYQGVCRPFGNEDEFLRWHQAGREVYKLRNDRDRNAREINRKEEALKKATKEEDRKALRDDIRQLDREQQRIRRTIDSLEALAPR